MKPLCSCISGSEFWGSTATPSLFVCLFVCFWWEDKCPVLEKYCELLNSYIINHFSILPMLKVDNWVAEKFVYINIVNFARSSYGSEGWIGIYMEDILKKKKPPNCGGVRGSLLCHALTQKGRNCK